MKNLVIILLVLLVFVLGLYVAKQEGVLSVSQLVSSVEKSVSQTVDNVQSKVEKSLAPSSDNVPSAMLSLPGDTAISLVFPAKAINPAITHLSDFLVKVKTSSLGKKLEIDKIIEQGVNAAEAGVSGPQANEFEQNSEMNVMPSKQPGLEDILKTIQNFERLEILLRAKTLEGKATPLLKVNASFKDDSYSKQLQDLLEGYSEMSRQGGGPELKKDEQDPQTYVLNIKPPLAPVEVLARVKTAGRDINASIALIAGTVSARANNNAASNQGSPDSLDSVIAHSAISRDSLGAYMNVGNFRSLIDVIIGLAPEQTPFEAIRQSLESSLGTYNSFASSSLFEKGFNNKTCSKFNGNVFAPFKEALNSANQKTSSFYKLIGPRTTLAARIDGSLATAMIESMLKSFADSTSAEKTAPASDSAVATASSQMLAQATMVQEELKKLKITDAGILANAPASSFVPDVGLYLEHDSGVSIEQFGETIQTLLRKLTPPGIADSISISVNKDSSGQTVIIIPAMEGYQLSIKSISPTQFFGSVQDSFTEEAKTLLAAKEQFIDDAKLLSKGVNIKISQNHGFYYMSTGSLMPLARQFAPFLTMSKPEIKINDTEMNQFLDLADFNILISNQNSAPEDMLLCSATSAVVY